MAQPKKPTPIPVHKLPFGDAADELVERMIKNSLASLCLGGGDLEAAFSLVLNIMQNGSHQAYNRYAVNICAYPNPADIDGVRYQITGWSHEPVSATPIN